MKNKVVKIIVGISFLFLGGILLNGCTTSRLVDVWKSPQYNFGKIHKVVVIAALNSKGRRRIWEDSFAKVLDRYGIDATPSYKMFPKDIPSTDDVHSTLDNKYDGIILVRKLKTEVSRHYVPGDYYWGPAGWYYNPFFRSYSMLYAAYHTSGYVARDRIVRFEASLYEANDEGTLIWDATSEVANPYSQKQLVNELTKLIIPNMMNKKDINS